MRDLDTLDLRALAALYGGAHGAWGPTMVVITLIGGGWAVLALLPLLAWTRTRRFGLALALAIVAQATSVWALKLAVGRVRPWIALGFPPPFGAPHDGSFPSGHASGSFCVAAFLAVALPAVPVGWPAAPWRRLLAGATIALAVLVAVSRVYLGAHFPSDVLAGGLFGACIGAAAGSLYLGRERRRSADERRLRERASERARERARDGVERAPKRG
jgi:membrane-associated phospholipid phosphatase